MDDGGGLADLLSRGTQSILERIEPCLERLHAIATELKMEDATFARLAACREGLMRPTFTLVVFGHFSAGKSTLLNVLLGRSEIPLEGLKDPHGAPLPMAKSPTSPRVTFIRYGAEPLVRVVYQDNRSEEFNLAWYVDKARFRSIRRIDEQDLAGIDHYELIYPFESGRAGLVLIDTPGIEDAHYQTIAAVSAAGKADAAIMMFNGDQLGGQSEMAFVQELKLSGLDPHFLLVNRMHGMEVDDDYRRDTWDRLVTTMRGGDEYRGQDLADERIFFVDARAALVARLAGDREAEHQTGIVEFEAALAAFLENERRSSKIDRWSGQAIVEAERLARCIDDNLPALSANREKFERAYAEALPVIAELEGRKNQPAEMIQRFRRRVAAALSAGFETFLHRLHADMPALLAPARLESLSSVGGMVMAAVDPARKARAAREAAALVNDCFRERFEAWQTAPPQEPGLQAIMEPLTEELMADLRREFSRTERAFENIRLTLWDRAPNWSAPAPGEGEVGTWWDRVAPVAAEVLFGPTYGPEAIRADWSKWNREAMSRVGWMVVAVVVRGALSPVLVVDWVTRQFQGEWKGFDPQREAKERAVAAFFDQALGAVGETSEAIFGQINAMTREFEAAVMSGYAREIDDKIDDLRRMQQTNAKGRTDTAEEIERFDRLAREVADVRRELAYSRGFAAIGTA